MTPFIPGLELCGRFYREAVRPILDRHFVGLCHTAGRIGAGSDVLGFDTPMSMDHDWGPRVQLFLSEDDWQSLAPAIVDRLGQELPGSFLGFPTSYARNEDATRRMESTDGRIVHRVEPTTLARFFDEYLGFDLECELHPADWLTFPEQKLRTIRGGAIFHDDLGLEAVRSRFHYYPEDVWRYLLTCQWQRIGQEEHLVGRAGYVGDEVGASIIASRLVHDLMRICFLLERVFAPYPKWFGTAFRQLEAAEALLPLLARVQRSDGWEERDRALAEAYEFVARLQNQSGLTTPRPIKTGMFYNRPFQVIHLAADFASAIAEGIADPAVRLLLKRPWIGSADQFSDSTDLLSNACWRGRLRQMYVEAEPDFG